MEMMSMLAVVLGGLLVHLPLLAALVAGFVMLAVAPAGRPRRGGLWGISLILLALLLGTLTSALPMMLMHFGSESVSMIRTVAIAVGFLVSAIQATGLVLLVLSLVRALRPPRAA
ncbi:hypothetical protein GCM10009090_18920 [[Pseudomonas] boreopolis]|uniref:Uncharacterized protein n=2 Tax=Pseudomonadota TaxID=1224 RepID=A0A919F7V0_9XANT|nr:hypothetical protein GCM10009090_18920 [[Pseudomonas] boreopolis]